MKNLIKKERLPLIIFLTIVLIGFIYGNMFRNRIRNNLKLGTAKVERLEKGGYEQNDVITYSYKISGKTYDGDKTLGEYRDYRLVGKTFPLAYNEKKPNESILLIYPKDFESFDLVFPDSLTWVMETK